MGLGTDIRLSRLFANPSGNLFGVAVDHFVGYGNVREGGLSDLPDAVAKCMQASPDTMTMTPGTAKHVWGAYVGEAALIIQASYWTPGLAGTKNDGCPDVPKVAAPSPSENRARLLSPFHALLSPRPSRASTIRCRYGTIATKSSAAPGTLSRTSLGQSVRDWSAFTVASMELMTSFAAGRA